MAKIGDDKNIGKETRFPNNDPTKGGAPKGKRLSTIIKELLDTDISNFSETLQGMDANKALAIELITMAFHKENTVKDKLSAIKEILDRIDGKPNQSTDITSNGDSIKGETHVWKFVDGSKTEDEE